MSKYQQYQDGLLNESIKGWKNAQSDIAKHRSAARQEAAPVKLVRLKKDGKESGMSDASSSYASAEEAEKKAAYWVSLNPGKHMMYNLYVDGKLTKTVGSDGKSKLNESLGSPALEEYLSGKYTATVAGRDSIQVTFKKGGVGRDAYLMQLSNPNRGGTFYPVGWTDEAAFKASFQHLRDAIDKAESEAMQDFKKYRQARDKFMADLKSGKLNEDVLEEARADFKSIATEIFRDLTDVARKTENLISAANAAKDAEQRKQGVKAEELIAKAREYVHQIR